MTVGELRAILADIDPDTWVLVRWNDDDCCHVAGVLAANAEYGCTDQLAFVIDADAGEEAEDR